jgi:hypothetical protein
MSKDQQRGKLLLAVMIRSTKWMTLIWSAMAAYAVLVAVEVIWQGKTRALSFLGMIAPLLTFALYPRARFYEGGIDIPPTANVNRRRFLRWDQIERYSWDSDNLALSGTSSVLAGGPVEGDVLAIPSAKRGAVEQILAAKIARSQAG